METLQRHALSTRQKSSAVVPQLLRTLSARIRTLTFQISLGMFEESDWTALRELLEQLPLSSAEFGLANLRLRNCRQYFTLGERGAARFELHRLLGTLQAGGDQG